jgi:hypothetical protein
MHWKNNISRRNPFEVPDDQDLFVSIDDCLDLKELDAKIDANLNGTCFFLVKGAGLCGLSSIAYYILSRYCRSRKITPERFLIPDPAVNHKDEFGIIREWLDNLSTLIAEKKIDIPSDLRTEFKTTIKNATPKNLGLDFRDLLSRIAGEMRADQDTPEAGFGVFFDDVKVKGIVEEALDVFRSAATICVLTIKE